MPNSRAVTGFAGSLVDHGDRIALLSGDDRLTYAELEERVAQGAAALGARRRLVVVGAATRVESVVAYLAALCGGHPVLFVADDDLDPIPPHAAAYDPDVVIGSATGWQFDERRAGSIHELHPDLALLLSTSGSTGSPRLVRLSHTNLQANAESIAAYLDITADDRAVTTLPLQYCYGLSVLHSHLLTGATCVLTSLSVVDPCFWKLFRDQAATSFAAVPHTFDLLDRVGFESMSLPSLRYITQAGGRLAPDTVRRYAELGVAHGWQLFVMYGQTEATARMAYLPPHLAAANPQAIGVPVPGGELSLEAVQGTDLPDGVGELVYRGPNVMMGYARAPEDLALDASVSELRTGDLARRTDAGLFEVVGRRSRFLKLFGLRIGLDDLEARLAEHKVRALCAGDDDGLVVAVNSPTDRPVVADVVAALGLPASKVVVIECDDLPRLANGKPDHAMVTRLARDPAAPDPSIGAAAGAEDRVRQAYAAALGVVPGDEDTFVGLGGDSLSYVDLSIALEDILGELPSDWHLSPVGALRRRRSRSRMLARLDTTVALRAIAIVLVVTTHTGLLHLPGGAHTLLAVAGFNFARFQIQAPSRLPALARVVVPSAAWIAGVAALSEKYQWQHVVFLNAQFGGPDARWSYWFIEALVQILVPLALVLSFPQVRRFERRRPFAVALAVAAFGLSVRFDLLDPPAMRLRDFRPHEIFWVFALGWLAARATTTARRALVTAMVLASVPGFFASGEREILVTGGLLLILWVRSVAVPRPLTKVAGLLAAGSLGIYLTHWQVFPPLIRSHGALLATVGSVAAGLVVWTVAARITAAVPARLRSLCSDRVLENPSQNPSRSGGALRW